MSVTAGTPSAPAPPARPSPHAARFSSALQDARRSRRSLLGACLPAGWPPALADDSAAYRHAASVLDIITVAVPTMSAPTDGPIMRAAHRAALSGGWRPDDLPRLVAQLGASGAMVLVTGHWHSFTDSDPARFAASLANAGAAGVIIPDMPAEDSAFWTGPAADAGLHMILVAGRRGVPAVRGSGAVYLPVDPGPAELTARRHHGMVSRIRQVQAAAQLPVLAGIGISTSNRAMSAARAGAEAVFLGSSLVAAMTSHPESASAAVSTVTARFRSALETARSLPG